MDGKILLKPEYIGDNILRIAVRAEDFNKEVLGIAFNLSFDDEALAYIRNESGNFLEQGGSPFYLVQPKLTDPSDLIFGATLKRGDTLAQGSSNISYLYFKVLKDEISEFSFSRGTVATLRDSLRENLHEILWEDLSLDLSSAFVPTEVSHQIPFLASIANAELSGSYFVFLFLFAAILVAFAIWKFKKLITKK